jgi:hypothetical protein
VAEDKRLSNMEHELGVYSKQKSKSVEPRVLNNLAMYVDEQWSYVENGTLRNKVPRRDEDGKIREVSLVLNMIAPRQQKIIGRLTASTPDWRAWPGSNKADHISKAEVATSLSKSFDMKLDEEALRGERWFWNMQAGVWFEHTPWRNNHSVDLVEKEDEAGRPIWEHLASGEEIPDAMYRQAIQSGEALVEHFEIATEIREIGDVAAEVRGPLNVFNPNSIRSIEHLAPGQSVMMSDIKLAAWVKKTWPNSQLDWMHGEEEFKIITTKVSNQGISFANTSLRELIPVVQGAVSNDDPDMVPVFERYEPPSPEFPKGWSMKGGAVTGPNFFPAPNEDLAGGGRYTVFIPGQGIVRDGEIPYKDGIPIVDGHWDSPASNFYNRDWATGLMGVQKSINTLASQIRTMANARVYDPILIDDDTQPPNADMPKYWVGGMVDGMRQAERLGASSPDPGMQAQLLDLIRIFDDLSGAEDLLQNKKLGQIRGTGAVQMLQDVMDSQWGPKIRSYYNSVSKVIHKRVNRAAQFYPTVRTLRFMRNTGKVEAFRFHAEDILRSGVDYTFSVSPSSMMPQSNRERFANMTEMLGGPLAGLYQTETGEADWHGIAAELQFGDIESRESMLASDVKFAKTVIADIKEGRGMIPVLPVQNHLIFVRELQKEMNDDDFFKVLSEPTQQALIERYQSHQEALANAAEAAKQETISEETIDLVRQAVQQSLAKLSNEMPTLVLGQIKNLAQNDPQAFQTLMLGGADDGGVN